MSTLGRVRTYSWMANAQYKPTMQLKEALGTSVKWGRYPVQCFLIYTNWYNLVIAWFALKYILGILVMFVKL